MEATTVVRLFTRVADGVEAEREGRLNEFVLELTILALLGAVVRRSVKE